MACHAAHTPPATPVCVAVLQGAHGVRGQLRVYSYTDNPLSLKSYGPLWTEDGTHYHLTSLRPVKGGQCVGTFAEVDGRDGALALRGTKLYVDRSVLPDLTGGETFYQTDLIGREARINGLVVGHVINVGNYGAGDMLEIRNVSDSKTCLVPFHTQAVPELHLNQGYIVLNESVWQDMQDADPSQIVIEA